MLIPIKRNGKINWSKLSDKDMLLIRKLLTQMSSDAEARLDAIVESYKGSTRPERGRKEREYYRHASKYIDHYLYTILQARDEIDNGEQTRT